MLNDERDISVIVREFHHRYHALAESAGYRLVFEAFKLIQQYLPCREIGLDIGKLATDHPDDVFPVGFVITIATPISAKSTDIFWRLMPYIPFAVRVAKRHKRQFLDGVPVDALGFDDDEECAKGIHKFYTKMIMVSSGITTMGLIDRHQLLVSPHTYGIYGALGYIARDRGQVINKREKQLFALFFDIFLANFQQKLRCSEQNGLLPILALEAFKARELACIKTCFDLKHAGLPITRHQIASTLYFDSSVSPSATELKKALDKVDYDFKKIKARVFNGLETTDDQSIQQLYLDFSWSYVVELFKLFAFSGFYPDASGKYISNVQLKMGEWAPH